MTELDFDELDKAVNSLMGEVETTDQSVADVPIPTNQITPSKLDNPENSDSTMSKDSPAAPSLATKRRGQFMDMVHPSSDMKAKTFANNGPAKRQSVTISPSATAEAQGASSFAATSGAELTHAESSVAVTDDIEPKTTQAISSEPTQDVAQTSDWPDPLDVTPNDAQTEVSVPNNDTIAPLDSPFLADAKPEKRPLGAPQSSIDAIETPIDPDVDAQTTPSVAEITQQVVLPDELRSNVVSIESDTTTPIENTPNLMPVEEQPTAEPMSPAKPVDANPLNGSIPQQYKEAPNTGDQASGSIYDTANYHKAIEAHASGKKGGALKWVIWIVLLLVVGAGGGAAFFMFTR